MALWMHLPKIPLPHPSTHVPTRVFSFSTTPHVALFCAGMFRGSGTTDESDWQSKEVRKILQTAVHVPSEGYALFPPVGGIIDHLGVAAAKVTLAYRLEVSLAVPRDPGWDDDGILWFAHPASLWYGDIHAHRLFGIDGDGEDSHLDG